jgi:hypothetical protein
MIYQDVYSSIQPPTSMYGLRKQVEQDELVAQQNQIAIQQKARTEQEAKAKALYQSMNQFGGLSEDKQSAMYQTYRQKWESLMPEAKGIFPSVWDSKDPTNKESLGQVISFLEPLVPAEEFTLSEGQVRYAQRPGGQPTVVARGASKEETGFAIKRIPVDGGLVEIPEDILPSGNILAGPFVYDRFDMSNSMPKEEYFKLYPSERPVDIRPESQNKLNATPQAVPNQTELPPRNFNAPSSINRAGETNVGFPIDENAMMQQQQIMPTMGNMMLRGAGAVMADEFAPQPRNALVGGMMPQPSQFAELMPAGSAPNRFGSPGVEGIDFAATGSAKPQLINGLVVYPGRPKPVKADNPKDRIRPATADDLAKAGIPNDTGLSYQINQTTGEITPVERLDKLDQTRKALENAEALAAQGTSAAQRDKAESDAKEARIKLRAMRAAQMSAIRMVVDVENDLLSLAGNEFVDTGTLDRFVKYAGTATGNKLKSIDRKAAQMNNAINHAIKITGAGSQSDADVALMLNVFPDSGTQYPDNMYVIGELRKRMMDYIGLDAIVRTDDDFNAIPNGSIFYDSRSQTILRKIKD